MYMNRNAYIADMWGRVLHSQGVRSVHDWVGMGTRREGSNHPMQSGAQGTIKIVMQAVNDDLEACGTGIWDVVHPLLQVHDELLFEVREDMADEVAGIVKWRFETLFDGCFAVDIKANEAKAINWGSLPK
jgi:DNA polymerase-1